MEKEGEFGMNSEGNYNQLLLSRLPNQQLLTSLSGSSTTSIVPSDNTDMNMSTNSTILTPVESSSFYLDEFSLANTLISSSTQHDGGENLHLVNVSMDILNPPVHIVSNRNLENRGISVTEDINRHRNRDLFELRASTMHPIPFSVIPDINSHNSSLYTTGGIDYITHSSDIISPQGDNIDLPSFHSTNEVSPFTRLDIEEGGLITKRAIEGMPTTSCSLSRVPDSIIPNSFSSLEPSNYQLLEGPSHAIIAEHKSTKSTILSSKSYPTVEEPTSTLAAFSSHTTPELSHLVPLPSMPCSKLGVNPEVHNNVNQVNLICDATPGSNSSHLCLDCGSKIDAKSQNPTCPLHQCSSSNLQSHLPGNRNLSLQQGIDSKSTDIVLTHPSVAKERSVDYSTNRVFLRSAQNQEQSGVLSGYEISPTTSKEEHTSESYHAVFHVINDTIITSPDPIIKTRTLHPDLNSTLQPFTRNIDDSNCTRMVRPQGQDQALDLRGQTQNITLYSNCSPAIDTVNPSTPRIVPDSTNSNAVSSETIGSLDLDTSSIWVNREDIGSIRIIENSLPEFSPSVAVNSGEQQNTLLQHNPENGILTSNFHSKPSLVNYGSPAQYVVMSSNGTNDETPPPLAPDNLNGKVNVPTTSCNVEVHSPHQNIQNKEPPSYSCVASQGGNEVSGLNTDGRNIYTAVKTSGDVTKLSDAKCDTEIDHRAIFEEDNPESKMQRSSRSRDSPRDELDIAEDHLLKFSVRDLNKVLHGLPKQKQKQLKQKRRTLKNRGYAQNCRSKRMVARQDLEVTNIQLHKNMKSMMNELTNVKKECAVLKELLNKERLEKKELQKLVISLRGGR